MSLRRFESPSRRDDSRFNLVLDEESRDYIRQQAGVDQHLAPERCTATRDGLQCTLTAGHESIGLQHSNNGYWTDLECS